MSLSHCWTSSLWLSVAQRKTGDNADKELYNIVIYQQQQFFIQITGRQKPDWYAESCGAEHCHPRRGWGYQQLGHVCRILLSLSKGYYRNNINRMLCSDSNFNIKKETHILDFLGIMIKFPRCSSLDSKIEPPYCTEYRNRYSLKS